MIPQTIGFEEEKEMRFVELKREENVTIMTMNHKESNAFSPEFVKELHQALDEVVADPEIGALIVTGGAEKYFCTGLDTDWIGKNFNSVMELMPLMTSLFKKLLLFPMPTLACINGHAYAGGVVLAFLMDYRFMRQDKGFLRCPEVTIDVAFPFSMVKVVEKAAMPSVVRDMLLMGKKYDGPEALKAGLVDAVFSSEKLLSKAIEVAKEKGQLNRRAFSHIKQSMYGTLAEFLQEEDWQEFMNFSFGNR